MWPERGFQGDYVFRLCEWIGVWEAVGGRCLWPGIGYFLIALREESPLLNTAPSPAAHGTHNSCIIIDSYKFYLAPHARPGWTKIYIYIKKKKEKEEKKSEPIYTHRKKISLENRRKTLTNFKIECYAYNFFLPSAHKISTVLPKMYTNLTLSSNYWVAFGITKNIS